MKLILSGIVIHLIFLASIFDVYFNSPVIQGIEAHYPKFSPKAKRLVLFVADGLRASTFFGDHMKTSPYLREIVETRGSWGVSHTRVPTESRPGHVALIAGLYEDPSAVTKGWKENPVEFDSVFNRSQHTWAWGSPDILPMFAKGEAAGRVTTYCYPTSMQKFSGDGSNEKLDTWVIDNVLNFFNNSSTEMKDDGVIFFLHLLGIDTAGHATKPHSRQYLDNIRLVDVGVKKVEEAIERFYGNDGKTAYIFTSDHGMTDWGSHGAGLPDETETPLVVWGSGLSGPNLVNHQEFDSPKDWDLDKIQRRDVEQADIAALMSALLAIPTPTNSVGLIPCKLLSASKEWIIEAMLSNAQQILLQLKRIKDLVHERLLLIFLRPFPHLQDLDLPAAEEFATQGIQDSVILKIEEIEKLALDGIQYYQEYFSEGLKWSVTSSHVLWLAYLAKSLLLGETPSKKFNSIVVQALSILSIILTCILVIVQHLPLQYIIYYSLPSVLLLGLCRDIRGWWADLASVLQNRCMKLLLITIGLLLAVAVLVLSFYFRASLSFGLIAVAAWPLIERKFGNSINIKICIGWGISCIALSVFPMLPVIGRDANYLTVLWSGLLTTLVGFLACFLLSHQSVNNSTRRDKVLSLLQVFITFVAVFNVYFTAKSFDEGLGLVWYHQLISWGVLVSSFILPFFVGASSQIRLLSVWLSLASILILLSVSHEPVFLLCLLAAMSLYPAIEFQICDLQKSGKSDYVTFGDLRRAYFYLFFTVLAFFGLGNIASLNSFDPAWVRCLMTTFSPHFMAVLILLKTIVPFLAVACGTFTIAKITKRPVQWLLVLGFCDGMSLPFFHLVVTRGSWLDVGQSISHFVIAHACVLFLLLLYRVADVWLSVNWCHRLNSHKSVPSLETAPSQYIRKSHRE